MQIKQEAARGKVEGLVGQIAILEDEVSSLEVSMLCNIMLVQQQLHMPFPADVSTAVCCCCPTLLFVLDKLHRHCMQCVSVTPSILGCRVAHECHICP